MNQYQKTTEKKQQAIIQAALRLFKDKGFKQTSIKSIAEAAEVSPVSIYNYFGAKIIWWLSVLMTCLKK